MSQPPDWIRSLVEHIATRFISADVLAPLACHHCEVGGVWEITLFASQTEIMGGPQDGGVRVSRFHLDLKCLFAIFDTIDSAYWQAHGLGRGDELGPHVGIEGTFQGHRVWLRLPATAPQRFPAGRHAHIHQRTWEECW